MKKIVSALLLIALSVGCTSIQKTTRIASPLKAKEFNSIASKYLDRPTFVSVQTMSDGQTVLTIERDDYLNQYQGVMSSLRFSKDSVSRYLQLIQKYEEWEKLARDRGDQITKEIGREKAWGNLASNKLKFLMHSGNSHNHFLAISNCSAGTCLDERALYFSSSDAQELKLLLIGFDAGKIVSNTLDDVYK